MNMIQWTLDRSAAWPGLAWLGGEEENRSRARLLMLVVALGALEEAHLEPKLTWATLFKRVF